MNKSLHKKLIEELKQLQDKTLVVPTLLFTVILTPLNPLGILTLTVTTITHIKRYHWLLIPLTLTYTTLIILNLHIQATLLILITVPILYIAAKRRPSKLIIGLLIAGAFSTYMLTQGIINIIEYVEAVRTWITKGRPWYTAIYLTLVMVVATHIAVRTPISQDTKIAKYIKENPGAPPTIYFTVLLLAAATVLALGREKLANKFAEIAYYNLALGVTLQLIPVISERKGSETPE
ncbi:MAG: hypothetical protein DRO18_00470 [Thermoprotei archaeon]|nr:MAG: hypothetical protein DRO18_00470 [Thermoprotei archaeon]